MTASVFPLPLTPLERYLLLDDRPGYPMTFVGQVDFGGSFQPAVLEDAVRRAHRRHFMLRATVDRGRTWRVPTSAEDLSPVRWLPWTEETPHQAFEPIDLGRETGFRLFVQQDGERSRWTAQFHHAAVDAQGAARVLWDVAAAYVALSSATASEPDWVPADPEQLRRRSEPRRAEVGTGPLPPGVTATPPLGEVVGFLRRRPACVRAEGAPDRSPTSSPPVRSHTFDAQAFGRIRQVAQRFNASVNDVFLCALLRALAEWNAPAAPYQGQRWLRVLVPTDLRTRDDADLGAANVLGFAFVDRQERECGDAAALMRSVSDEMRGVRLGRVGHRILDGLAMVDRIPGLLRLVLRRRTPFATVVFTNVGRMSLRVPGVAGRGPDALGSALPTLRRITGAAPLRPGTRAGLVLSRLRGTATLTLRTDHRYLGEEASQRLLAAVVGKVMDLADLEPAS